MQTTLAIDGGTPVRTKPFPAWPVFDEREERALLEVLHSGKWWQFAYGEGVTLIERPDGPKSRVNRFQDAFARAHGCKYGIAATNGTATLEIILKAMGIGPGDEVIVPAYTFIASASAVLSIGAVPIFVDIDPKTFNIDPRRVEEAITDRTQAIMPVHFGGQSVDTDAIDRIAAKHDLWVLEDAAHAHGSRWRGKPCGSLGDAGSFSFQASKNMTAGEGGIITSNNKELADRCRSYLWAGREPGRPWYEHHRLGGNHRMTEFQGAILQVQLERLEEQTDARDRNGRELTAQLLAMAPGLTPAALDPRADRISFHVFMMRYDAEAFGGMERDRFVAALNAEGIPCMGGYTHPLYRNPMFLSKDFLKGGFPCAPGYARDIDYGSFEALCPVSEDACKTAVWLHHHLLLGDEEDVADIVQAISKIHRAANASRSAQAAASPPRLRQTCAAPAPVGAKGGGH